MTFITDYAISPANISILANLKINCTSGVKVAAISSFQFYDNGTSAYFKYKCSFSSQISQNPKHLFTNFVALDIYLLNELNISCPQNFISSGIQSTNTAIQSFEMEVQNFTQMRYRYTCVSFVQVLNTNQITSQTPINSIPSCSQTTMFNYLNLTQGPENCISNDYVLLTKFNKVHKIFGTTCQHFYNYTYFNA